MFTEATGDSGADAVDPAEPDAAAGAEPTATAVAEPVAAVPADEGDADVGEDAGESPTDEGGAGGQPEDGEPGDDLGDQATSEDDQTFQDTGAFGDDQPFGDDPDDPALAYDDDYEVAGSGEDADESIAPPRARRWPRALLVLGFVVLAAVIVGGAVAIVGSVTHGFQKPVKVTYTKSPVFSLRTGDCFDPNGQAYSLVSCGTPHEAEVFATFALAGAKWPGTAAVAAKASGGCASRLPGYLNPQLAISLSSTYVYPDATAWQAGTRTVVCEVRATSGELTGSVRGASATAG